MIGNAFFDRNHSLAAWARPSAYFGTIIRCHKVPFLSQPTTAQGGAADDRGWTDLMSRSLVMQRRISRFPPPRSQTTSVTATAFARSASSTSRKIGRRHSVLGRDGFEYGARGETPAWHLTLTENVPAQN
jgi:hypothetical protein